MRYTIAAVAAFASIAAAIPQYGYEQDPVGTPTSAPAYPEYSSLPVSSEAPESYPVSSPPSPSSKTPEHSVVPVSSSAPSYPVVSEPSVPEQPVSNPVLASSKPVLPATSSMPTYPEESCASSTTITVTVPYPTGTAAFPVGPKPSGPAGPSGKPPGYVPAPYPSTPVVGTGVPPKPVTPTGTGAYTKPSIPAQFTGAASSLNAAGFVAGVGAFAAFFL